MYVTSSRTTQKKGCESGRGELTSEYSVNWVITVRVRVRVGVRVRVPVRVRVRVRVRVGVRVPVRDKG